MLRTLCSLSYRSVRPRLVHVQETTRCAAASCVALQMMHSSTKVALADPTTPGTATRPATTARPSTTSSSTTATAGIAAASRTNLGATFTGMPFGASPWTARAPSAPPHKLHVQASRNNTILTLTQPNGNPLYAATGGTAGFKKSARSGYEAAYRAAFQVFREIESKQTEWRLTGLEIFFNGFGQGREAFFRALMAAEGTDTRQLVRRMTDTTRLKVGGVRPKKRRML